MSEIRVKRLVVGIVGTNTYLVYDEETKKAVVVDPGDRADLILEAAERLELMPEAILLTHGHFDHIMAANELKAAWHVPVYACKKEEEIMGDWEKNLVASYYDTPYTVKADVLVEEGDTFEAAGFVWKVLETPGHTIGSCCYYIEKEKVLFSGDTLFCGSYGRTDLPTGSGRMIIGSVTRLLEELPDDVMVYPGHMDETTIGFEKKNNPLARFLK